MMRMMVWNWGMQRMWKASAVRCCHLYLQCMLPRCLCCHRRGKITPFRPAYFVTQWTIEGWTSLHISCSIQHLFSLFQVVHFVWYALPVAWYGIIGMQHCNPALQYCTASNCNSTLYNSRHNEQWTLIEVHCYVMLHMHFMFLPSNAL